MFCRSSDIDTSSANLQPHENTFRQLDKYSEQVINSIYAIWLYVQYPPIKHEHKK